MATASISEVRIANLALSHIGARSTIESLTENSTEAKQSNLWYDFSRIQALEAYNWGFARKRLVLAEDSLDPPEDVWTFRYQYPADCVSFRNIENPFNRQWIDRRTDNLSGYGDAVPFEIELAEDERKTILTDMEDACGVYTKNLEQTDLFTTFFVEAFSYLLAHHTCMALTGKLTLKKEMQENFLRYINLAPSMDANERVDRAERDARHVRFRTT